MLQRFLFVLLLGLAGAVSAQTPCPSVLLVSGYFSTVHIYDACSGQYLRDLDTRNRLTGAQGMRIGPDGFLYVVAENNNTVYKYRGDTLVYSSVFTVTPPMGPLAIDFSSDGTAYVAGYDSNNVMKFDRNGTLIGDAFAPASAGISGPEIGTTFGPDGNLYVPGYNSSNVIRHDPRTGQTTVGIAARASGIFRPRGLLLAKDGQTFYVVTEGSGQLLRWNFTTGALTQIRAGLPGATMAAYAPDGNLLVVSNEAVLKLDPQSGATLSTLVPAGSGGMSGATFLAVVPNPDLVRYALAVSLSGSGAGSVASTPAGIGCGSTCSATFQNGDAVTLTPTASAGSVFTKWTGACSGSGACSVTMNAAKSVTAIFSSTAPQAALSRRGGIDTDGDGKGEFILRNANAQLLAGRLSGNQLQFSPVADPGADFRLVAAADFDGNGKSDLAFQNITQGDFGEANTWLDFDSTKQRLLRNVKRVWDVQAVGDLDGDGFGDLVWRYTVRDSPDTGVSYIWFTNGAPNLSGSNVVQVRKRGGAPLEWRLLGAMDLNGDGAADMVYLSPANQIRVLMATAQRTCANYAAGSVPADFTALAYADFTGNRRGDIFIRNAATGATRILSLDATALTLPPPTANPDDPNASCTSTSTSQAISNTSLEFAATDPEWSFFASADLNGDGVTDLIWKRPDGTLTVWLMTVGAAPATVIDNAGTVPTGFAVFQP